MKVANDTPLPLKPGLAIMFNAHRRHSVQQGATDVLAWLPVYDEDEPIPAVRLHAIAMAKFRRKMPVKARDMQIVPHPTADRATAEKALEWGREG